MDLSGLLKDLEKNKSFKKKKGGLSGPPSTSSSSSTTTSSSKKKGPSGPPSTSSSSSSSPTSSTSLSPKKRKYKKRLSGISVQPRIPVARHVPKSTDNAEDEELMVTERTKEVTGPQDAKDWSYSVGIDFGTTRSGIACIAEPSTIKDADLNKIEFINLDADSYPTSSVGEDKSDTILLIKSDASGQGFDDLVKELSQNKRFHTMKDRIMIGKNAYHHVVESGSDWFVARDFKMNLDLKTRQERDGERDIHLKDNTVTLSSLQGTSSFDRPLLSTIALFLRVCADIAHEGFLSTLEKEEIPIPDLNMIKWVVTVPAIWRDQARTFMREAAVAAHIMTKEQSHTNLKLCLEPEGAMLDTFLIHKLENRSSKEMNKGDKVMIIDLGGGTADITVQSVETFNPKTKSFELADEHPPTGGCWGGRLINHAFRDKFLKPMIPDQYRDRISDALYPYLMSEFEKSKQQWKHGQEVVINMMETEKTLKKNLNDSDFEFLDAPSPCVTKRTARRFNVTVPASLMEEFFKAVTVPLERHLKQLLRSNTVQCATLIGGMGSNQFIQSEVTRVIQSVKGSDFPVICPNFASVSVVRGAALFGRDEGTLGRRRARATYGLSVYNRADPSRSRFDPLIYKTNLLKDLEEKTECKHLGPYCPVTESQTRINLKFLECDMLQGDADFPEYIDDPRVSFVASSTVQVDMSVDFDDRGFEFKIKLDGPSLCPIAIRCSDGQEIPIPWETR